MTDGVATAGAMETARNSTAATLSSGTGAERPGEVVATGAIWCARTRQISWTMDVGGYRGAEPGVWRGVAFVPEADAAGTDRRRG